MTSIKKRFLSWVREKSQPVERATLNMPDRLQDQLARAIRLRDHNQAMVNYWDGLIYILELSSESIGDKSNHVIPDLSGRTSQQVNNLDLGDIEISLKVEENGEIITTVLTTDEAVRNLFYRSFLNG